MMKQDHRAGLCPAFVATRSVMATVAAFVAVTAMPSPGMAQLTAAVDDGLNAPTANSVSPADTQWYRDAGFGIFIHWGLYSEAGGEWNGKRYFGITEHLMRQAKIPARSYIDTLARSFDPKHFDADAWVRTAKQAGARYIIVTTKHHDGFAMFHSRASRDNVFDATPFHRDPLAELAAACRRQGMRLGLYYSHVQDWSAPGGWKDFDGGKGRPADFDRYLHDKAEPQVHELLTHYGPVSLIWFDTPKDITKPEAQRFYDLVKHDQPHTLVNSRVGADLGDIRNYGDSEMPDLGDASQPWEAIYTDNDGWGYSKFDHNFKSSDQLIRLLATAASRGGNMVLNVGPDGDGQIPVESRQALSTIGAWLRTNGTSIYEAAGTTIRQPWGVATARGADTLFLHVFERPVDGQLVIPGLAAAGVSDVRLLDGNAPLTYRIEGADVIVVVPAVSPSPDHVIVVRHSGPLPAEAKPSLVSTAYAATELLPATAVMQGDVKARRIAAKGYYGVSYPFMSVSGLATPQDSLAWPVQVVQAGDYDITLDYAANASQAGHQGMVTVGGEQRLFQVLETGTIDPDKVTPLHEQDLGRVHFDKAGVVTLRLSPLQSGADLFTLKKVVIRPVTP